MDKCGRSGFALLAVLWAIMLAGTMAFGAAVAAREGAAATANRAILLRAAWARNACAEVVLARHAVGLQPGIGDRLDLGQGVWCAYWAEDPDSKIDLNLASDTVIATLLGSDSLAAAVLDWRDHDSVPRPVGAEASWYRSHQRVPPRDGPFGSVDEILMVRGATPALLIGLREMVTIRGTGRVNLNTASPRVLAAIADLPGEAVEAILRRREVGRPINGNDELMGLLSSSARSMFEQRYHRLSAEVSYTPSRLVIRIEAGVRDLPLVSRGVLIAVPVGRRLAIVRQELE